MQTESDIIIVGAGAAGLAAARELSIAGLNVIVLEGRNRIGGRISTHFDSWPIELGAELTTQASQKFKARRLLSTLPLSLMQEFGEETARIRFTPSLDDKLQAARKLSLGHVVKVLLRFRDPFWEQLTVPGEDEKPADLKKLTFVHAPAEVLPTWWTQFPVKSPLLTGWAGGSRADRLSLESEDSLLDHSLQSLCHIFRTSKQSLEQSLEAFYTHNWHKDPFTAGAYSYIPVGGLDAQSELARPLEDTLFFAGEATNDVGHHATVHGAIATGIRGAKKILDRQGPIRF